MRVKLFTADYLGDLEEAVNEFLAGDDYAGVLDIKFSESNTTWSVMVMYMPKG